MINKLALSLYACLLVVAIPVFSVPASAAPKKLISQIDEAEPRTPISVLPVTITKAGSYYLTGDLTETEGGDGITIEADNVTLDLRGFSLAGSGAGNGIYMSGRRNVEIRNGTVRNFDAGIFDDAAGGDQGHRIVGVRALDNATQGIWLPFDNHLITDCIASNNGGSGIIAGPGSLVTGNIANHNGGGGIGADAGSTVGGNTANHNAQGGIQTQDGATVTGNTANDNGVWGIAATTGTTVAGNTADNNGQDGIFASIGSNVYGNTARNNASHGISVDSGSSVKDNTASYNQGFGIVLVTESLVDGNTAFGNSGGANMDACASCTFGLNHAP